MRIENKDFWDKQEIVHSQDKTVTHVTGYESYLYKKASDYFAKLSIKVSHAKIFGCGTGREILAASKFIDIRRITASDISESMIAKATANVKEWNVDDKVEFVVEDAVKIRSQENQYELVTLMGCVLTFIVRKEDRTKVFNEINKMLKPEGCVIGVVHHQLGTPQKTIYFLLRRMFKKILKHEPGYRPTGFYGYKVKGYYFTKKDLKRHLQDTGFVNIEIKSLSEYYKEINVPYNRLKGMNNLIFFATK